MDKMKRALRRLVPVLPVMETPEQREARERLEFFQSFSSSEQLRLSLFFETVFGDCEPGHFEFLLHPPILATPLKAA
jgi:hypothetical protein